MQNIIPPINFNTTGKDANNLQEVLLIFIDKGIINTFPPSNSPTEEEVASWSKMLQEEKAVSYYGEGTRILVFQFQIQQGLSDNFRGEVVEETTAARFNEILQSLGILDKRVIKYVVKGHITSKGSPMSTVKVVAYDKDMFGIENLLGETQTDKEGYFKIEYTEEQFKRTDKEKGGADLIIRIVDAKGTVITSSHKINNAKADETVNVEIGKIEASTQDFIVYGSIIQDGKPLVGALINAYDKDLRRKKWLGEAITNATGNYEIVYSKESFIEFESVNVDLFIEILNKDKKLLGTSAVFFNAAHKQEINLALHADENQKSEWELLNEALLPLLEEQKESDIKTALLYTNLPPSELLPSDIQFLSKDTGLGEETIRKWALAHALAKERMIQAEVFFGWFSKGLPEQPSALWKIAIEELITVLKQAITDHIIPAYVEDFLEKLKSRIQQLRDDQENSSLLESIAILSSSLNGDQNLLNVFTKIYLEKKGNWAVIKPLLKADASFSNETVDNIFFTHGLMTWSNSNTVLINTFQQDATTRSLRDIAINFDKQTLAGKIPDSAVPPTETKDNFTTFLYNALFAMEPTGVVVNMINDPKVPLWNNEMGKLVSGVLSKELEFNMKTASIHNVIKGNMLKQEVPKDKIAEVVSHLKTLQRVTLNSPIPEAVPVLIRNNYLSISTITALPKAQFMITMLGSELPNETIQYIYSEAEKKKAFYEKFLVTIKEAGERTGIAMIDGNKNTTGNVYKIDPKVEEILSKNDLSWDLLFGDADFCECGECTSVYSAAAYYVDLLQYLRNNNLDGNVKEDPKDISDTPLEKLFTRRPDLGHLKLTCKNTNTILPYVDLVNEVMEQYIALKPEGFKDYTGFNVDDETSGELLSAPQHTEQEKAYQTLQTALFPFSLPYHQPIDATRIYLNKLNTSRYEIIDTFRSNNTDINFNVATDAEYLGLTEEEYSIITGFFFSGAVNYHTTDEYYGLKNNTNWLDQLSQVKDEFLPRTGILYSELVELLKTEYINVDFAKPEYQAMLNSLSISFTEALNIYDMDGDMGPNLGGLLSVNPDLEILLNTYDDDTRYEKLRDFFINVSNCIQLDSPNNHCSLDGVALHRNNASLTVSDYDKIQRFIRIWRKIEFTIDETDKAIMTLGSGVITPELIHQLAVLKKIKGRTGIEVAKLLCFWGNMGTAGENPLYKRLFLSHNLTAMDEVFESDLTGNENLYDHLPIVMAALNLTADDISLIKVYKSLPEPMALTLDNLSLLYRYRILSKTLGLRVRDFIKLAEVAGDVFENPDMTLRFLKNIVKMEDAGFGIDELSYVINGSSGINNFLSPAKKEVIILAKKLYDGQTAIEIEHADLAATNPTERVESATSELVRSKAALLYETDSVEKIISILEGTTPYSALAPVFTLNPDFPNNLKLKVKYNSKSGTGLLQVCGALTAGELTQLRGLVSDADANKAAWNQTIKTIEDQQNEFFNDILSGIFTPNSLEERALKEENNAASAPSKRTAFLSVFLPYLREKLIQTHIVTTLVEQTGLNKTIVQSLMVNILEIDGFSAFNKLISPIELPANTSTEVSWYGKLIPVAEDNYTLVIQSTGNTPFTVKLDNRTVVEHQAIQSNGPIEEQSVELKLEPGKVYQLSLEGIGLNNVYWKTKTSSAEPIPTKMLLPDFKKKVTRAVFEKLKKIAILVNGLSLSVDELNYFHTHSSDFNILNFNELSFYHLGRIVDYCNLRNSLPKSTINILQFWEQLNQAEIDLSEHIYHLTKWKKENIDKFITRLHFNLTKDDFKNEKSLLKLQHAFGVASAIGMDIDSLFDWAIPVSDFDVCKNIADSLQKAVRSQYNQTDWEQVVKPLNDLLRNNQKNALIAYLLQLPELKTAGITDADGLFEYFLIDVQMDTCMETSRIKQAISSVQLFIQRCFLGLEGEGLAVLSRDRWEWMQRYRVWEANRKVFLYPENWIESNLRDDKSPFFKELESELLQKDINKQNVTDALKSYLYKAGEVANMEVVSLYIEGKKKSETEWDKGSKLHIFSRTRNAPHFFYYRYLALDEINWYPWEKVQVDIPSYDAEEEDGQITGNGCYLTSVVFNGRLLIFFPQFLKKLKQAANANVINTTPDSIGNITVRNPVEYWEIKMAWSEYRNGKWTQKQLSSDSLLVDHTSTSRRIDDYMFILKETKNNLIIAIDDAGIDNKIANGAFVFDGNQLRQALESEAVIIPLKIPMESNVTNPAFKFQNLFSIMFGTTGFPRLHSFQSVDDSSASQDWNWKYFNDFIVYKDTQSIQINGITSREKLYSPISSNLTEKVNSPCLVELFKFNLSIGTTEEDAQIVQSDIDDAFGNNLDSNVGKIYHELKRPYSLYNWELFFHTPIMIADALSKAQHFEEAMKWFHYVFNPIADESEDNRFWMFRPFKEINSKNILEQIFNGLNANEPDAAINEWRNNPFKPHLVARSRPVAYMKWVVMKYIDNILDWGDYLFRQDTIESINQATQMYVLAGHILGPKPMMMPKLGEVKPQSYLTLLNKWDAYSNAISELEVSAIYNIQPVQYSETNTDETATVDIFGTVSALYFCIPNNPKLMGYWDTMADRLFKIRHSQNIEGVFRKLPLFEPPIDPALLVKAAAQGLSIASVVNDLNTSMPNYRFYYLLQKALELCNELKSLGGSMLSAIEKKDNETVALIRAKHEGSMNNLMMEIKKLQLEEAKKNIESLVQNRKSPDARMRYYLQLMGETDKSKIPTIDTEFNELVNSIEGPLDESGLKLSKFEKEDHDKSHAAHSWQMGANMVEGLAAIFHAIPNAKLHASPFGVGGSVGYGGTNLGNAANAASKVIQIISSQLSFEASNAAKKGGFQRALQDRIFQANAAGYELKQIDKQITAQQIRISIANQEITNQQKQMDNANEVEAFLKNKYTNEELYTWMRESLKTLYHQVYNLAYDLAKKAEKTYCFERGISNANFIQSGYFDAGREGLLAGEQLYVGLKQLEAAYQEKRGYDYEITKHISLRQLDPLALLLLKTTNSCEFKLPEVLFDMDYPGHFKRRIKSVSISIPCIAGPYTGVNATLRLLNNKFRNSAIASNTTTYPEKTDVLDERFISFNIPITAIATSSGQNDAGMFELNFKDERYLPFEGAGVISGWRLELPTVKQFDYNTISDVVLHVKYMASEGGDQLKNSAGDSVVGQLNSLTQQLNETGLHIPISLKHDMPNEWHLLKQKGKTKIKIDKSRLPYMAQSFDTTTIESLLFLAKIDSSPNLDKYSIAINEVGTDLSREDELNLYTKIISGINLDTLFTLSVSDVDKTILEDLLLIVKYKF